MLIYGLYNAEMLEKLINTVHHIHNMRSSLERLFAEQQSSLTLITLCKCTRFTALFYKFITLFKNSAR